ncbi:MAG: hypothetical protein U9R36_06945, partial [Elusimicrobiota bacterium]|nr:hypothetical protein [Elusimicrobiota bacterium]
MKKKFKIITALAAGLLILSAGLVVYLKSRRFTEHLKTVINKRGSDYLQSEVSVGRIDTDIFNNLVLSNVIIDDPSTSQKDICIPKIKVKYSFIKILKNIRNIPDLISAVSLYNPKFNVVKSFKGFTVPGLEEIDRVGSGNGAIPPWKFNIVDADIALVISATQTYRSRDFNSTVMLSGYPEIYARSNFSVEGIAQDIDIETRYHIIDKKVSADIVVSAFMLESLGEIDTGFRKVKFEKGTASLSLNASGRIRTFDDLLETVDINGEIKVADALSGNLSIVDANINISPHRLRIDKAALRWNDEMVNVAGVVSSYLRDPYLDIEVDGEIAARELLGQSKIENISGVFDVEGYLRGRPGMLEAEGRVSMEKGTVRGYKINNLNTTARVSTSTIKIGAGEMGIAGGRLRWTGQWDIENKFDITATAEKISMAHLTKVDRIRGTMSGNITARGGPDSPAINSDITIEDFAVPGKNFGRLDAQFNYDNSEIRVNGFSLDNTYSINGRLHLTGEERRLNIKRLEIEGADGGFVKSTGYMRYSPFFMEIETTGSDISHRDLPGFTELYKDASGNFSFSGDLRIKADETRIGGRFTTDNLMLGSRSYQGAANIGYHFKEGRKVFQIDGLDINDTVKGGIKMVYEKDELTMESSSVTAASADLGSILRVLKMSDDKIDGKVSGGFIFISGEGRGYFESGSIHYGKDDLGSLAAHFGYDGRKWDIDEFSLDKESGSLKIDGTVADNQELDIELSGYEFSGRVFNGRGNYRGGWG